MDTLIKRMDHTERARRENEAPLLQEAYAQKIKASLAVLSYLTAMQHAALCASCIAKYRTVPLHA